ncbi:hypothetical protein BJ944DRAFT_250258 [Cunninghamella echinulata]|nr:hypothetical protein BJ944DRAFT_250258 [Cunninghamella echinulata]
MKYLFIFIGFVCLFFSLVKSQSGNQTENCMPSNCQAICTPACVDGKTCVLGTMKLCGQCPTSSCVDNSIIGAPHPTTPTVPNDNNNNNTSNGPDGGMIGGLVGGLVGGGLLIGACVFYFLRRQNKKKHGLPFIATSSKLGTTLSFHPSHNGLPQRSATPMSLTPSSHQMTSVITHHSQLPPPSPLQQHAHQQQQPASLSSSSSQLHVPPQQQKAPSHIIEQELNRTSTLSRPTSSTSFLSEDDDRSSISSVSHRGSAIATSFSLSHHPQQPQQQTATKAATAFQVTRIKPQIMRVNTIRVLDSPTPGEGDRNSQHEGGGNGNGNLSRSGSVRTILTRDNSMASTLSRSNTAPTRPRINKNKNENNNDISTDNQPQQAATTIITPSKRISAPLLSPTNNPFHDRHSVIEEKDEKRNADDNDNSGDLSSDTKNNAELKPTTSSTSDV